MDQAVPSPAEALPQWLTEEYFRSLFRRKSPGEEVTVQKVTVRFGDEERVHGKLVRAVVQVSTPSGAQTRSFVVKRPQPGVFAQTAACANMYRMETLLYGTVIPAMERALDAVAPGAYGQLAPRLVDHGDGDNLFIMLEDVAAQGFKVGDRQVGLDLEHSFAYVKHLAAFHAASVAVLDRYESEITAVPLLIDSEEVKYLNGFIETSVKCAVPVVEALDEEGGQFAEAIRQLGATLPQRLAAANRRRASCALEVLCHGDMFVNNILLGREGGVRLVDFQLARLGSCADDVVGFLVSAAADDVIRRHFDEVLEAYRAALNEALRLLGLNARAVSADALREELLAQRAVAQFALLHMLPHSRTPGPVDQSDGAAVRAFRTRGYQALLRDLLPFFNALGWLREFNKTTQTSEKTAPTWIINDQALHQHPSPGVGTTNGSVAVGKSAVETTTVEIYPPDVNTAAILSRRDGQLVNVENQRDGKFCTTMSEMKLLSSNKEFSSGEKSAGTACENSETTAVLFKDLAKRTDDITNTKDLSNNGLNHSSSQKVSDLYHLRTFIHLTASLMVSIIASQANSRKNSDKPPFLAWSNLKEVAKSLIEGIIKQSQMQDNEQQNVKLQKLGGNFKSVSLRNALVKNSLSRKQKSSITEIQLVDVQCADDASLVNNFAVDDGVDDSVDDRLQEYRAGFHPGVQTLEHRSEFSFAEYTRKGLDVRILAPAWSHVGLCSESTGASTFEPPRRYRLSQRLLPGFDSGSCVSIY